MARSWCVLGCLSAMALVLGGCEETPRSNKCSSICEKRELCDSATDEADCVDDCLSRTYLSEQYMSYWAQCVAPSSVSCNFAMDDASVDDCVNDKLRAEPTPELIDDVCRALSSKLAACDEVDPVSTERACQRGDSLKLSDEYLEQSRECVDGLCEEVEACFEDLADSYDTNLSIVPTATTEQPTKSEPEEAASGLVDQVESDADDWLGTADAGPSL